MLQEKLVFENSSFLLKQFPLSEQNWNDIIKHIGSGVKSPTIYTDDPAILLPISDGYF
jgi:hypothetical protein